ncbi:MAG: hypothetical protein K0R78_3306 [Pelosinus sp.]|jgi:hypothetical protein|nr:hypothetical protein [Pelosinus sp.]
MIIKNALQKIEGIVRGLKIKDIDERLLSYSTIVTLLNRIEEVAKNQRIPNYIIYRSDLLESCEALCELDDNKGHDDGQHLGRALSAIAKLRSYQCFNVDNHHI